MAEPDLSEFKGYERERNRRPCKIAQALEGIDAADRNALDAALVQDRSEISYAAIQRWFAARDREVSATALINHRSQKCACHG